VRPLAGGNRDRIVGRVRTSAGTPNERDLLLVDAAQAAPPAGFGGYLFRVHDGSLAPGPSFVLGEEMGHLDDGDVVVIEPARPAMRVLYLAKGGGRRPGRQGRGLRRVPE
jgi:hypothetical protein